MEFGEKQIPAHHLRLVEGPKATQHFYVALSWDVGHGADSERRKDAASVGRRDAAEGGWRRITSERGLKRRVQINDAATHWSAQTLRKVDGFDGLAQEGS